MEYYINKKLSKQLNLNEQLKKQRGWLPEMDGMIMIWDRNDPKNIGLVTGDRYYYRAKVKHPCKTCGALTNRVLDYLGTLEFSCGFFHERLGEC